MDAQLRADAVDRPGTWIWVYHHPPDESPTSWTGRRHIGDTDLNDWIEPLGGYAGDVHTPNLTRLARRGV